MYSGMSFTGSLASGHPKSTWMLPLIGVPMPRGSPFLYWSTPADLKSPSHKCIHCWFRGVTRRPCSSPRPLPSAWALHLPEAPHQRLLTKVQKRWRGLDQPGLAQNAPVGSKVGVTCVWNINTGRAPRAEGTEGGSRVGWILMGSSVLRSVSDSSSFSSLVNEIMLIFTWLSK